MPLSIKVDELKNNIMKSTIRIKQDWEKNEPYIQLKLDTANPNEEVDLADSALIHFVQRANNLGLELVYQNSNEDNRSPQIRLKEQVPLALEGVNIGMNSIEFRNWLSKEDLSWNANGSFTFVLGDIDVFDLGVKWGIYYNNNAPRD